MDLNIFLVLLQDGLTNGSIYALLAISLVLVFAVTRVIFVPQGEFVTYGALTAAAIERGMFPPTALLLLAVGIAAALRTLGLEWHTINRRSLGLLLTETIAIPLVLCGIAFYVAGHKPGMLVSSVLSIAIVTVLGPLIYRLAFQPLENATTLTLLIAAVGVHLAMVGLGLVFFGPDGVRLPAYADRSLSIGPMVVPGQSMFILAATLLLSLVLYFGINRTLIGQALMATAVNRLGARLSGIAPSVCGRMAFALAALIGALSGLLIAPLTTIYYDSGFVIGLKGFVAAIFGGLVSFPAAAIAALGIGVVESFASFTASAFKEAIVFLSIIPVLVLRSLMHKRLQEEE
jgi:branched-chain amino acid transport system permease protein